MGTGALGGQEGDRVSGDGEPGNWSPLDHAVLRQVLDGTPAGVGIYDPQLRYVYVNPALARMNGLPADAHVGRRITEVLPDLDDAGEGGIDVDVAQLRVVDAYARRGAVQHLPQDRVVQR